MASYGEVSNFSSLIAAMTRFFFLVDSSQQLAHQERLEDEDQLCYLPFTMISMRWTDNERMYQELCVRLGKAVQRIVLAKPETLFRNWRNCFSERIEFVEWLNRIIRWESKSLYCWWLRATSNPPSVNSESALSCYLKAESRWTFTVVGMRVAWNICGENHHQQTF